MDLDWEKKVYGIVLRAQEKRPEELTRYLEVACAGDEKTRLEVERRLEGIQHVFENFRELLK